MQRATRRGIMRIPVLAATLVTIPLMAACASSGDDGPTPYDDDFPVSDDNVNEGAPPNDSLPDDNKADAVYPAQFQVQFQSPVKSQGSRGVCSIFASTALIENLYIKAGMPVADADFSEQYLQWAAKNLGGGFPHTEGSSSNINLSTVVEFGTVKEAEWAYESFPWSSADDAECTGGENLPTKCYTNGEPPASVEQAEKFDLPSSRWINTNSIKAHLTSKGTGVNVGFTFFYQSWNHRRSTLPISNELWRQGVVTYPNAKDKEESAKHRAGHAIQIVGWDDNFEVAMRDGDGNPVLDSNGEPKKEKGFWIIKNSWGTASFGVDNPAGAGYGYLSMRYVSEYGSAVTAEMPDFQGGGGGGGGGTAHNYSASPSASIPDNSTAGAASTISVPDTGTLTELKITVDISHSYRGDLTVTLSHDGTTKTLTQNSGGSDDDLKQTFTVTGFTTLAGDWTLSVVDNAAQDTGTLNSWSIAAKAN
jgi:hypothetical protein